MPSQELTNSLILACERIARLEARLAVLERPKAVPALRACLSQPERDALALAVDRHLNAKLAPLLDQLKALESRSANAGEIRELAAAVRAIKPGQIQKPLTRNLTHE